MGSKFCFFTYNYANNENGKKIIFLPNKCIFEKGLWNT